MGSKLYFDACFNKANIRKVFRSRILPSTSIGLDGITSKKFEDCLDREETIILRKVKLETYSFTRYKEKLIVKAYDKNPRQISIPTVRDKLVLRVVHEILKLTFASEKFYRPQKIVSNIKSKLDLGRDVTFIRVDVKNFYPTISHEKLISRLKRRVRVKPLLTLIRNAMENETGLSGRKSVGIPQGLSISNLLANIYLLRFDDAMLKFCESISANYYRYVDDILIISSAEKGEMILARLTSELKKDELVAHEKDADFGKTTQKTLTEGINYLGYRFQDGHIFVRPRSLQRMYDNILKAMSAFHFGQRADNSINIFRLNLKISGCVLNGTKLGWLQYFSEIDTIFQLHALDAFVMKHAKRKIPLEHHAEIKSFVRSYFVINHLTHESDYVPNFDKFNIDEKIALISKLTMQRQAQIVNWSDDDIILTFETLLKKEAKKLETDVKQY